jgi:ubiquinone/menaquinone biosynthesis C-methylase UbiE
MSIEKHDIAMAYDEWAETYDTDENRTRDLASVVLQKIGLDFTEQHVVEVGCGTGRNTIWLAEKAAEVTALDFSEAMLGRAKQRISDPRVTFIQHDAREPWPLLNHSADVVIAMLVLEHIDDVSGFMREAARVLRAGGVCFICELHPARQLTGSQAQFTRVTTGERQRVTAFTHSVSDFVNPALAAGFQLKQLGDWRDQENTIRVPRLLSLLLNKP